jgi:hypothetical protein
MLCTHICTWKMIPVEPFQELGGGIKENGGGDELLQKLL